MPRGSRVSMPGTVLGNSCYQTVEKLRPANKMEEEEAEAEAES